MAQGVGGVPVSPGRVERRHRSSGREGVTFEHGMIFLSASPTMPTRSISSGKAISSRLLSAQVGINNVTFEPLPQQLAHPPRHERRPGQLLACVAGTGWYQEWGKPARLLPPRRCSQHSRRSKTLAWCYCRQLVCPSGH